MTVSANVATTVVVASSTAVVTAVVAAAILAVVVFAAFSQMLRAMRLIAVMRGMFSMRLLQHHPKELPLSFRLFVLFGMKVFGEAKLRSAAFTLVLRQQVRWVPSRLHNSLQSLLLGFVADPI